MSGSESEKGPNQMPPIMMSVGSIAPEPPRMAVPAFTMGRKSLADIAI